MGTQLETSIFLMLTPLGREWVQGQDPSPEDETGYLAVLTGQITNLDPIIMDYVKEAVAAYSQRLHFASAVMIGAASEKAVYLLMEAFSKSAKDPIIQRKTTNAMEERKLPGMFSCLSANLTEAKKLMPYPIHEGCGPHLTSLLEAIRVQRNEAVHPMAGQVTAQSVMADLRYAGSLLHESSVVSGSEFSVVKVLSPEDGGHRDHKQCETSKKEHMGASNGVPLSVMIGWMRIRDQEPERWEVFRRDCLALIDAANEIDGTDKGNIQLFNPFHNGLQIIAQRGFKESFLTLFDVVRPDAPSACARAFCSGQQILISDINEDLWFRPYVSIAKASGFRAVQSTPIAGQDGSIIGVFSTHAAERHTWEPTSLLGVGVCAAELAKLVLDLK